MRVTQILRACGLIDLEWADQEALDRGTAVHAATAIEDRGEEIDSNSIDPRVAPYLPGWHKFKAEVKPEILAIEERVTHQAYGYTGTFDRLVKIGDREGILDLKSGPPAAWHRLQLCLYALCFSRPLARWGLYLTDEGAYKLIEFKDRSDYDVARGCISVANFKEKNP